MKKMKTSAFLAIWISVAVVILALGIAFNLMATTFSSVFTSLFNWERGQSESVPLEGTEDWDADYYSYTAKSLAEATANANKVVEEISNEGFVLLKNNDLLPLSTSDDTIAMYGRASVDPILGGSGSGNTSGASTIVRPYDALTTEGFTVREDVYNFFNENYSKYQKGAITMDNYDASTFFIGEVAVGAYSGFTPVKDDVAVVFIGRGGGEGWDLSTDLNAAAQTSASQSAINGNANVAAEVANYEEGQHQLELTKEEKDMVEYAKSNYDDVVVVINSSHAMELGVLEDDAGVDAMIWVGSTGAEGYRALGNILSGAVNPSGRLVDTYAADFTADPTFPNEGMFRYSDIEDGYAAQGTSTTNAYMMQYEEGIYVGYKYYETAYAEAEAGNYDGFDYDSAVVYPFGYGLSYTTFEQNITDYSVSGDSVTVTVEVTNTGDVDGKEVVQLYYTPPYIDGGIEKAAVNLIAFDKVEVAAGETEEVKLTFAIEDMASYDYKKTKTENGGYVLDAGEYEVSLRANAHTYFGGSREKAADGAGNCFTFDLDEEVFEGDNKRDSDESAAENRFDDISTMLKDEKESGYGLNFSRSDFAGTFPTAPTDADLKAKEIEVAPQQNGGETVYEGLAKFDPETDPTIGNVSTSKIYSDTAPVMGAGNGVKFSDMRAIDYDDPAWEQLLDNILKEEYVAGTFNASAYNTAAIESIGKPRTNDPDGPAGITSLFGSTGCCAYMSEVVLASTWNTDLGEKMGDAVAEEAYYYQKSADSDVGGTSGWYGPAMNIHRSPFGGRNFEYYSEDGLLGGYMGAAVIRGAASKGVYSYLKHYALNDSEIFRTNNLCVWANEQAIRELYLKPFELTIKNSEIEIKYIADTEGTIGTKTIRGAMALMSSFNRLGTTWAGGHYGLMTEVPRGEWGFDGVVVSDFNLYEYTNADQGIRAGTDMQLAFGKDFADAESTTALTAMRRAFHNMCYTTVNSNVMQGVVPGATFIYHFAGWQIGLIVLAVALYVLAAAAVAWIVIRMIRVRREG